MSWFLSTVQLFHFHVVSILTVSSSLIDHVRMMLWLTVGGYLATTAAAAATVNKLALYSVYK